MRRTWPCGAQESFKVKSLFVTPALKEDAPGTLHTCFQHGEHCDGRKR
jgi:hypothetical protein